MDLWSAVDVRAAQSVSHWCLQIRCFPRVVSRGYLMGKHPLSFRPFLPPVNGSGRRKILRSAREWIRAITGQLRSSVNVRPTRANRSAPDDGAGIRDIYAEYGIRPRLYSPRYEFNASDLNGHLGFTPKLLTSCGTRIFESNVLGPGPRERFHTLFLKRRRHALSLLVHPFTPTHAHSHHTLSTRMSSGLG